MDQLIVETVRCFDSVKIQSLEEILGVQVNHDLEGKLIELILSGKLANFRIDDGYLINQNPKSGLRNILKKLEIIQSC